MQSAAAKPQEEDDIDHLLKNIPACIRCRQNHRRCDPSLPFCRNCVKAGHPECVYFDPILGEQVERSRVMALASRLRELRAASVGSPSSSAVSSIGPPRADSRRLYLGNRACIQTSLLVPAPQPEESTSVFSFSSFLPSLYDTPPSAELHSFLLQNYRTNLQALYPVLDDDEPLLDPRRKYDAEASPAQLFRLNMIYSTSCLCISGHRQSQSLLPLSKTFHRRAMEHVDGATSDVSIPVLRNFSIMALNSLFAPDQGNLNQLIGIACRMCVDLSVPRSEEKPLQKLFLAILCMERQVAIALDRPLFMAKPSDGRISEGSDPAEIFWSLLSIQCFLQRGLLEGTSGGTGLAERLRAISSFLETREPPTPSLISTLRETELLFAEHCRRDDPAICRAAASQVLLAHDASCLRTCLSPHWTFRASSVFLRNCPANLVGKASHEVQVALLLLDRDAVRWPSCRHLVDQLRGISPYHELLELILETALEMAN